jgi:hypothetical protein
MTSPRRTRSGHLVPWAVNYFAGIEEQERLRGQGVELGLGGSELGALGRAMAEQREALATPEARAPDPAPDR